MPSFTNVQGLAPSPPEKADPPESYADDRHAKAGMNRYIHQAGLLGVDTAHCQAPTKVVRGYRGLLACGNKPVCVMVENAARPDGKIAAMALCASCRDIMLRSHGADYAKLTPLP